MSLHLIPAFNLQVSLQKAILSGCVSKLKQSVYPYLITSLWLFLFLFSCFYALIDDLVKPVVSFEFPIPPGESPIPDAPPTPPPTSQISDIVDAPPPAMERATQPEDSKQQEAKLSSAMVPSNTKGSTGNEAAMSVPLPVSGAELALESPIAQPEELQLVNGSTADVNKDVSPLAEPDITKEAPPIIEECAPRTTKVVPSVEKEIPTQVVSETTPPPPLPVVKESCVLSVKEPPAPKPAPAPVVTEVSTSVVSTDTPSLAVEEIPPPAAKENPTPVVLETPDVKEAPPSVATETSEPVVKETVREPCPVAKDMPEPMNKETPSPSEPVCVAAKATPPSPPPPPPPAEEREDMSPPQTTATESTMQGTSK